MRALKAIFIVLILLFPASGQAETRFPGVGHRYLVDFQRFVVELYFESETKMTYTGIGRFGDRGASETVNIEITPLRRKQFLVTWTESDKTVVVHIEDFRLKTIRTNVVNPDHSLEKYSGSMKLLN